MSTTKINFNWSLHSREQQTQLISGGARSENYGSIDWTKSRIDELFTTYIREPLSMQCNQSDGSRFAGYNWEGAPTTQVDIQVPLHRWEVCKNYNPLVAIPLEQGDCGYLGECIY